ncbi:hypothetical protein [Flavobacterium sp.]|uniref:hypothetical protein n=1 Tax=Flavobacterium sp. TaxID=239 RepID=UPI002628C495|nr:hypothetical protein [Flavobacterium sp.]
MKTLKQIFVEFEIGEIYPENLPHEIINILESTDQNDFIIKITNLYKPTRADILEYLYPAFGITEKEKLSKKEKLVLLINRWINNKLETKTLHDRIHYFGLEDTLNTESFDYFIRNLSMSASGNWVPGDEWDWTIENIEKDLKAIENRYYEFII